MDLRRVRVWEWMTGLAGAVLLVSLFLPWYETAGGAEASAWESFAVIDVVLALAAVLALALPVIAAMQRTPAVPQSWTALLAVIAVPAAVIALVRLLNLPDLGPSGGRAFGVWLGAASALAIVVFDYKSMADKSFPRSMRPRLDVATIPTPTADGERRDTAS